MKKFDLIGLIYVIISFIVLIIIFLPNISYYFENPPSYFAITYPSYVKGYFIRQITVLTISKSHIELNVTLPLQNVSYQKANITFIGDYSYKINHAYNRTWYTINITESSNILINYSFNITPEQYPVSPYDSLGLNAIPQYLKNEYDHPEYLGNKEVIDPSYFVNISREIVEQAHANNVFEMEYALYSYIVKNFKYYLTYSTIENPMSAVQTWQNKAGDCAELSFLYASMSRALGIPAWIEFGWLYGSNGWGQHAWIETVIPTTHGLVKGIVDLTIEVHSSDLGIGFFVRDPYRITEWVDDGNSSHFTNYYTLAYGSSAGSVSITDQVVNSSTIQGPYIIMMVPSWSIPQLYFDIGSIGVFSIIFYAIIRKPKLLLY
ncbi:MAG: transglutaminase-like domain-containing protein [Thermoplasmata archaeon]